MARYPKMHDLPETTVIPNAAFWTTSAGMIESLVPGLTPSSKSVWSHTAKNGGGGKSVVLPIWMYAINHINCAAYNTTSCRHDYGIRVNAWHLFRDGKLTISIFPPNCQPKWQSPDCTIAKQIFRHSDTLPCHFVSQMTASPSRIVQICCRRQSKGTEYVFLDKLREGGLWWEKQRWQVRQEHIHIVVVLKNITEFCRGTLVFEFLDLEAGSVMQRCFMDKSSYNTCGVIGPLVTKVMTRQASPMAHGINYCGLLGCKWIL